MKHRLIFKTLLLSLVLLLSLCVLTGRCALRGDIDRSVVKSLDLQKFMGRWYEIARFDHSFERGMTNVTAEYIMLDDGRVRVINRGMRDGH